MKISGQRPRRGMALLVLLLVLATISVLMGTITMQILLNRRTVEHRQQQLQATWPARSGVEVAIARLEDNRAYKGETLEIIPDSKVQVKVEPAQGTYEVKCEAQVAKVVRTLNRRLRLSAR